MAVGGSDGGVGGGINGVNDGEVEGVDDGGIEWERGEGCQVMEGCKKGVDNGPVDATAGVINSG
eukprot:scaffold16968_cov94-Amphora_coffeaeformis.AAC.2